MTNSQRPRVSIGLPVYNGELYLSLALDSLLAQTFTDFELTISDNASTDRTAEICRDYAARDSRIRYMRQERTSDIFTNVEVVLGAGRGEFTMLVGDDDVYEPQAIEKLVAIADANPGVAVVYSNYGYIKPDGTRIPSSLTTFYEPAMSPAAVLASYLRKRICLPMMMSLFRTDVLQSLLPFDRLPNTVNDIDNLFLLKLFGSGARVASTREVLFHYRLKDRTHSHPKGYPPGSFLRRWWQFKHNRRLTGRIWRIVDESTFPLLTRVGLKMRAVAELGVLFIAEPLYRMLRGATSAPPAAATEADADK